MYCTESLPRREMTHIRFTAFMNLKYSAYQKGKNISSMSLEIRVPLPTPEQSGIIVGAMAIEGNIYDGRTLKPQLDTKLRN